MDKDGQLRKRVAVQSWTRSQVLLEGRHEGYVEWSESLAV